ncbi:hypothetical protein ABK040_002505 [Willaertia magna]
MASLTSSRLKQAISEGNKKEVKEIIQTNHSLQLSLQQFNHHTNTPLHYALFYGYPTIIMTLLKLSFSLYSENCFGKTPIDFIEFFIEDLELKRKIIEFNPIEYKAKKKGKTHKKRNLLKQLKFYDNMTSTTFLDISIIVNKKKYQY